MPRSANWHDLLPLPSWERVGERGQIDPKIPKERTIDKPTLLQRAKNLRKQSTDTEQHLWYYLRANRLGFKFKRQVPLGRYIIDFVCLEKSLIIELDGSQHLENLDYDKERSLWLETQGFKVLRFWNNEVLQETPSVLEVIHKALNK